MTSEREAAYRDAYLLGDWSPWVDFSAASARTAPRVPGVYLIRVADSQDIVYVGSAGERAGGGRPMGLLGRLGVYWTGKGAVSGFGEAAFDRALADADWIESRLLALKSVGAERAKVWAAAALNRYRFEICWATRDSKVAAEELERQVVAMLRAHGIWNR